MEKYSEKLVYFGKNLCTNCLMIAKTSLVIKHEYLRTPGPRPPAPPADHVICEQPLTNFVNVPSTGDSEFKL